MMLRTALALAARGLHVFPCRPRDKRPATPDGLKSATVDTDTIKQWWQQEPQYNVAIATGAVSNVFVVDVDGPSAEAELRRLETNHGALPPTVETITPRPGRHIFFKMPNTPVRNSAGKVAAGIDVRGTGGFVVVPPSVHPSGRAYAWSVDCANALAAAPDWLLDKITERPNGNGHMATAPSEWRMLITDGVPEGRRDCTLARVTGYLLRHHIDPIFAAELVRLFNAARCLPPLPDRDVERIVNSIAGKELKRRQQSNG